MPNDIRTPLRGEDKPNPIKQLFRILPLLFFIVIGVRMVFFFANPLIELTGTEKILFVGYVLAGIAAGWRRFMDG